MPKIPVYERKIQGQALPGVRVNADAPIEAFGGGRALSQPLNAAQDVLGTTFKIAEQEYRRANETQLSAYNARVAKWETEFLHGPNGIMNRKGSAAFSAPEEAQEAFQKFHSELEEELATNADLRGAIRQTKEQRWADIDRGVQRHVGVERKRYEDESHAAYLVNERDAAVMSGDLKRIGESIQRQQQEIVSYAERNGIGADEKNRRLLEASSKTHIGHINQLLANGDDATAKAYYEDNLDGISPEDRKVIGKNIRTGNVQGESQRQATQIMSKHADDLKAALENARKIKDPEVQQATVSEIKTRFGENEKIKQVNNERLSRAVLNSIDTKKMLPPPEVWNAMSKPDQGAYELYLDMVRRDVEPTTVSSKYYELKTMMNAEDRSTFIQANLLPYRPYLNNRDFDAITTFQMELRAGKIAGADEVRTTSQIISGVLRENGIDPTPKDGKGKTEQWKMVERFTRDAEDEIMKATKEKGRPLSTKEKKAIVDSFVVEAPSKGGLWDMLTSGRLEATKPIMKMKFEDVPPSEVSKIEANIRARGGNPTKELITETYRKGQARKNRNAQ